MRKLVISSPEKEGDCPLLFQVDVPGDLAHNLEHILEIVHYCSGNRKEFLSRMN